MQWIAPSEKDLATDTLEKRLWAAADQFRANSGLSAAQYSGGRPLGPRLGLIFLRFAEVRFAKQRAQFESPSPLGIGARRVGGPGLQPVGPVPSPGVSRVSRRGSRVDDPAAYHAEGILYLAPNARFDFLLSLPEAADIGAKVNDAMRDISLSASTGERARVRCRSVQLAGVLPKTYNLFTSTLLKELLKKVSEIPARLDYDAFGRIYEYFPAPWETVASPASSGAAQGSLTGRGEFAMTEGPGGGEFYTPSSIVRLLTEVIEPYHGRNLDPACGSGGMFVSSARFVSEHKRQPAAGKSSPSLLGGERAGVRGESGHPRPSDGRGAGGEGLAAQYSGEPSRELSIHGVEKTDETGRLCRMNLAVHGLEGDIRHGGQVNSYYDDPHDATVRFDFVLANPPGQGAVARLGRARPPLPIWPAAHRQRQFPLDSTLLLRA